MKLLPQDSVGGEMSCYDAVRDVDAALKDALSPGQRYYVLGGIASGALANESTVIDIDSKTVITTEDSAIPTIRPNGTRRDVDILVNSVLAGDDGERIKRSVAQAVGNKLVVSVFGLDKHQGVYSRAGRLALAAKDWISHRTVDDDGVMRYELFPLQRAVEAESYEQWKLVLPSGQHVDVLHPAGHTLAYSMRSISGVRAKDRPKFDAMSRRILPKFEAEVRDGPFKAWADFAVDIEAFRTEGTVSADGRRSEARVIDMAAFRLKAKSLHGLESREGIVDFAQGNTMQRLLNLFVRAK